jgi:hypothetical protein
MKISRSEFYALGGFANPSLYRKMRGGAWGYWRVMQ